jgi:parallel beta-helix repeat protein
MSNLLRLFGAACIGFLFLAASPLTAAEEEIDTVDPNGEHAEWMKDEEWARIKRVAKAAVNGRPQLPPSYPTPDALEIMLAADISPFDTSVRRTVRVETANALHTALEGARPGDFIYLADGVYVGNFAAISDGTSDAPVILHGSRAAILQGPTIEEGYGLHITADHWIVSGLTIRNIAKGIVLDGANHTLLSGVEVYQTGNEGVHFRSFSSNNTLKFSWIHDTGLTEAKFGEAVYVGSAVSNWERYSGGQPDASDNNRIVNNLLGPDITAEAVDVKEGTAGGLVQNNTFITTNTFNADSWVDVKGNNNIVSGNRGTFAAESSFAHPVEILEEAEGWGTGNIIDDNEHYAVDIGALVPFRMLDAPSNDINIVLPPRELPYTLSELIARFPGSFEQMSMQTMLLKEQIVAAPEERLLLTTNDIHTLRLLSSPEQFVGIATFRSTLLIQGNDQQQFEIVSWDLENNAPDTEITDGRAYVFASGGRMDIDYGMLADLGFTEGTMSGAAWQGYNQSDGIEPSRGDVTNSVFLRNYFGSYTYEAVEMQWINNVWADNIVYGFDPHDFSNDFLVERNKAYGNGSHGIIFSRGCDRNIIRNNDAYDNDGNGIVLDDGKVLPDSEIPRYQLPVASDDNIVENNRMRDNQDGIVAEGGSGNIIRNNLITGTHRFGIRVTDQFSGNVVENNTVQGVTKYGIFVYGQSSGNQFTGNIVTTAKHGIVVRNSIDNTITGNTFDLIESSAMVLKGAVNGATVTGNVLKGTGTQPINAIDAEGVVLEQLLQQNNVSGWRYPATPLTVYASAFHVWVWIAIFLIPLAAKPLIYAKRLIPLPRGKSHPSASK